MITTTDIKALISFAIVNNKPGLIQAMNMAGNMVSSSVSDDELYNQTWAVFTQKGLPGLRQVLSRVQIDKSKVSTSEVAGLTETFQEPSSTGKFKDWFNDAINFVGDLIGGHGVSSTAPTSQQSTSSSALSPTLMGLIIVLGIILIIIFKKYIAVVVSIIVILLAVILYGIFAKNVTTTVSGGGTTTQTSGGIGAAIVQGLASLFGGG